MAFVDGGSMLSCVSCGANVGRGEQTCWTGGDWGCGGKITDDVDGVTEDACVVVPGADGELNERGRGGGGGGGRGVQGEGVVDDDGAVR